jgi:alpha-L-fucosidase
MGYLPIEFFGKVEYAQFLHDGSELFLKAPAKHHSQSGDQTKFLGGIQLPVVKPDVTVPVIELFLKK